MSGTLSGFVPGSKVWVTVPKSPKSKVTVMFPHSGGSAASSGESPASGAGSVSPSMTASSILVSGCDPSAVSAGGPSTAAAAVRPRLPATSRQQSRRDSTRRAFFSEAEVFIDTTPFDIWYMVVIIILYIKRKIKM